MSKLYDEHSDSLEIEIERNRENLLQFAPKVKEGTEDKLGKAYTLAVLQASNSIKSRETREEILKGLIVVKGKGSYQRLLKLSTVEWQPLCMFLSTTLTKHLIV